MSETNVATLRPKNLVPAIPSVPSRKMLAIIAEDLTPSLPDGMTPGQWLDRTENFVGQHPEIVLTSAMEAILSTFVFSPKKSEIIDAILKAYQRLGVELSPDAKKHLSFRKKLSDRYVLNEDGVKRFDDDVKITLVGFFTVQGPQGNIILDDLNKAGVPAIVDDVEKSIDPVQQWFKGKDKAPGDEVLARFKAETRIRACYRIHGDPASLCGGIVATVPSGAKLIPLTSTWVAMSEQFRDRMREQYPHARCRNNPHSWEDAMKEAFWSAVVSRDLDPALYGKGLQKAAEDLIERKMADLNREGRIECERIYRIDMRECAINIQALAVAEEKLKSGHPSVDRITIDGEVIRLDSIENCDIARRKISAFSDRINASLGALA